MDEDGKGLEGVVVSLQMPGSPYPEVYASTKTDDEGKYLMEAGSGAYVLVASAPEYSPSCESVTISTGTTITKDFNLSASLKGKISWNINLSGISSEASVTLHVLTASPCTGSDYIEVKVLNIVNGGKGETELPVGSYIINYTISETGNSGELGILDVNAGDDLSFDINI